jgi:hypothetical protein
LEEEKMRVKVEKTKQKIKKNKRNSNRLVLNEHGEILQQTPPHLKFHQTLSQ